MLCYGRMVDRAGVGFAVSWRGGLIMGRIGGGWSGGVERWVGEVGFGMDVGS